MIFLLFKWIPFYNHLRPFFSLTKEYTGEIPEWNGNGNQSDKTQNHFSTEIFNKFLHTDKTEGEIQQIQCIFVWEQNLILTKEFNCIYNQRIQS